jgi:hypothetical protein
VNPTISKKLLALLGVTLIAAVFGVRSLVTASSGAGESGFDGPPPLPLTGPGGDGAELYEFTPPTNPRNPFAFAGLGSIESDLITVDETELSATVDDEPLAP